MPCVDPCGTGCLVSSATRLVVMAHLGKPLASSASAETTSGRPRDSASNAFSRRCRVGRTAHAVNSDMGSAAKTDSMDESSEPSWSCKMDTTAAFVSSSAALASAADVGHSSDAFANSTSSAALASMRWQYLRPYEK